MPPHAPRPESRPESRPATRTATRTAAARAGDARQTANPQATSLRVAGLRAAGLCAALLGAGLAAPAGAQDGSGGGADGGPLPRLTFGIEQRLEANDNPALEPGGGEAAALAATALSFAFLDATPLQTLSVTGDLRLRQSTDPDAYVSAVDGPRLGFSYAREGASAGAALRGNYRRSEIAVLRSLADFPTGLPIDFEDLEGTGIRTGYGLDGSLEIGRDAPLGATFSAGFDTIAYDEATAELTDSTRTRAAARLRFRLSPVTEARAGLRTAFLDDDDGTERRSGTVELGFGTAVSRRDSVDLALGYTVVETERPNAATDREDGLSGGLRLTRETPTGSLGAGLEAETTQNGTRVAVDLGRSFEMPLGTIEARIGASRGDAGDTDLTGALSWRQDLPDGRLSADLARSVVTTDEEDRLRTALSAAYDRALGPAAAFGLSMTYARTEGLAAEDRLDVATLGARVSRDITADWAVTLGYGFSTRDREGSETATANSVYATIGRSFTGGF